MRYIILEPCAYPSGGHNIESCLRFARKLEIEENHVSEFWLAGKSGKIISQKYKVFKINRLYIQLLEDNYSSPIGYFIFGLVIKFLQTFGGSLLDYLLISVAKINLIRRLKNLKKTRDLVIFMPSADYYYAVALLELQEKPQYYFKVKLRFIGVMENARFESSKTRNFLFRILRKVPKNSISLTAETNRYAKYISSLTGKEVFEEPYPIEIKNFQTPILKKKDLISDNRYSSSNPLNVILMGKPRADKGNLDIRIISKLALADLGMNVHFNSVAFPKFHRFSSPSYKNNLHLNSSYQYKKWLPKDEFNTLIDQSDVILLPYDVGTYWYRGSAVFFDALELSKKGIILVRKGIAFSDEMYKRGVVTQYSTVQNLISKLKIISQNSIYENQQVAIQQRKNYFEWYSNL